MTNHRHSHGQFEHSHDDGAVSTEGVAHLLPPAAGLLLLTPSRSVSVNNRLMPAKTKLRKNNKLEIILKAII